LGFYCRGKRGDGDFDPPQGFLGIDKKMGRNSIKFSFRSAEDELPLSELWGKKGREQLIFWLLAANGPRALGWNAKTGGPGHAPCCARDPEEQNKVIDKQEEEEKKS